MRKLISYPIDQSAPGWPGNPKYSMESYTSINNGDTSNTYTIHLFNHFGTHMDAPKHFYDAGACIDSFPIDTFIYQKPVLLDIPKKAGEMVTSSDLEAYSAELSECDLLLIRTGFGKKRGEEPSLYAEQGPAISADAAKYLMEKYVGKIRAVALDFISLASPLYPEDGTEAHRWMCGQYCEGNIFIIEDVNMSCLEKDMIKSAAAIPLYLHGVDSSPVTMWVEEG